MKIDLVWLLICCFVGWMLVLWLEGCDPKSRIGSSTCQGESEGYLECETPKVTCYFYDIRPIACFKK